MQHSDADRRKESGAGHRTAIFVALWMLIAVTLLSALAPLGPPLSRMRGSAFNPATSDVALRTRPQSRAVAMADRLPDRKVAPPAAILLLPALVFAGRAAAPMIARICRAPVHIAVTRMRAGRSRAPPPAA